MAASLIELLGDLTDPRDPRGVQYPLVPVPALCLVAALAGHTGFAAIAPFGRLRRRRLAHALGFRSGRMPRANMLSKLLRDLDADHLDRLIGTWLAGRHAAGWDHVALDGKTARGSRDGGVPGRTCWRPTPPGRRRWSPRCASRRRPTSTRRRCACWACCRRCGARW